MLFLNGTRETFEKDGVANSHSTTQGMDINSSDEHHSSVDSTLSQTEINEATLSDRTEPSMFPHATSLDLIPSSGQQEEGARPRDRQRQHSLPGRSTTAPLPPQQSETLAGDLKANYSQSGSIHEDDHGPQHAQMQLPVARPLPFPLPQQDGLADNFIMKHSCDITILEDLHMGTQMQHIQAVPPPSVLQEQVIDPEVADGLEVNFLARHSQDESIFEDLYKDDDTQVLPPLAAPQPWPSQQHFNNPEISGETLHSGLCGNRDISTQGMTAVQAERDAGSMGNALNVDSTQVAIAEEQTAKETCQHYKRKCFSWFSCCEQFMPCHRCHNSRGCCKAEASNATHLKCSKCGFVQEIGNGATCQNCTLKMAAYFCSICKHLSNVDNEPYHCEKCGVCRSYRTKAFHCDICGLCMNRRFQDKHKCRPSSAHDKCCICLEDMGLFGCHVLSCSHKMHRKCYVEMRVKSDLDTCPICRQAISHSQRE
ncbi:uncharacterized protein [Montipora capricornis]|uniref:uncharacterized protein n=1 Tax=Montipora capricornis TaxID=246305 RepID=UPI0035F14255